MINIHIAASLWCVAALAAEPAIKADLELDLGNGVKMKFVKIPKGKFTMGALPPTLPPGLKDSDVKGLKGESKGIPVPEGIFGKRPATEPLHEVEITADFYMAVHETTVAQYRALGGKAYGGVIGGERRDDDPAFGMNRSDAVQYCVRLNDRVHAQLQGRHVRLPTEAEWEYACRAGGKDEIPGGKLEEVAWHSRNSRQWKPVAGLKPNAFGLYDMLGNVEEFCLDECRIYDANPRKDPVGKVTRRYGEDLRFAVRGGSYHGEPYMIGAGRRETGAGDGRSDRGFRLVIAPDRPAPEPNAKAKADLVLDLGKGVKLKMVKVKAGTFMRGSPDIDKEASSEEKPDHPVTISRAFHIATFETTQEQFEAVMGRYADETFRPTVPALVDWATAVEFCNQLNRSEHLREQLKGLDVRLPTSAEWEYACRAGTRSPYSRPGKPETLGWFKENSDGKPQPVGMKLPNAWGIHDMHGNAGELCWDARPTYTNDARKDPYTPGNWFAVRGGSAGEESLRARSAANGNSARFQREEHGFRIVLVPAEVPPTPVAPKADLTIDLGEGVSLKLVKLKAGKFQMGAGEKDYDAGNDEKPRHQVTLTKEFHIGVYEVTQAQYRAVMGRAVGEFVGDDLPAHGMSYERAVKFCDILTLRAADQIRGAVVRLPTEAEWEYACRAGSTGPVAGTGELAQMGWFQANSRLSVHPVGRKKPNAWGLFDMQGNVSEHCVDADRKYEGAATDPRHPLAPQREGARRGGAWNSNNEECRVSNRRSYGETGFRIVVVKE